MIHTDIMRHSCNTSILTTCFTRLTMRRCHNALEQTKQFGESKLRFLFELLLVCVLPGILDTIKRTDCHFHNCTYYTHMQYAVLFGNTIHSWGWKMFHCKHNWWKVTSQATVHVALQKDVEYIIRISWHILFSSFIVQIHTFYCILKFHKIKQGVLKRVNSIYVLIISKI